MDFKEFMKKTVFFRNYKCFLSNFTLILLEIRRKIKGKIKEKLRKKMKKTKNLQVLLCKSREFQGF